MSLKKMIRFYQPICLYSHSKIIGGEMTIEHIVPVSVLSSYRQKNDPLNMYMASASVNNFRSNFRFAELDKTSDAVQERHGSLRLLSKRLFCPYQGRRLIAHIVWSMLDRYDGLEEERIFDDPLTFWSWQRQPWTPIERVMLERQQEFIQKKNLSSCRK